jgi:hypothetical protein
MDHVPEEFGAASLRATLFERISELAFLALIRCTQQQMNTRGSLVGHPWPPEATRWVIFEGQAAKLVHLVFLSGVAIYCNIYIYVYIAIGLKYTEDVGCIGHILDIYTLIQSQYFPTRPSGVDLPNVTGLLPAMLHGGLVRRTAARFWR